MTAIDFPEKLMRVEKFMAAPRAGRSRILV